MRRTAIRLILTILGAGAFLALAVVALSVPAAILANAGSGVPSEISLGSLEQRSYVYGADGSTVAGLHGEINREPIALDDVPSHLVQAILAVEDQGFWLHDGVDARGILRAFVTNVDEGGVAQGGSTLTQQVVKLGLLGDEQTLDRKVQEVVLARRLEKEMSKEDILTRYINVAYFGHSAYGVEAAAETYFGISASELDIGQSALLAGMIRNPRFSDPVRYPEAAADRRETALTQMVGEGYITEDEKTWFSAAPLPTEVQEVVPSADDYFVEEVLQLLLRDERFASLGSTYEERERAVFRGGIHVYTTFDPDAQRAGLEARDAHLPGEGGVFDAGGGRQGSGAMVSVDPATGAIRTMVAGPGFERGAEASGQQFNLAVDNERQPGSTQKTFILAELMEQGYSPLDRVDGTGPCLFANPGRDPDPYEVPNYGGSRGGVDTIVAQTARSSNCGYMRMALVAGYDAVAETARKMGATTGLGAEHLSMPLGVKEVTPLQMASAYATLANDGVYNEPYYVERIEGPDGQVLFEHEPDPQRAVSAETARLVTQVLATNVTSGTGTAAAVPGHPMAGKTGTTNRNSDVWFVGYSAHLATAVWVGGLGSNEPILIDGVPPGSGRQPAQMFGQFMTAYHSELPPEAFPPPAPRPPDNELLRPDPAVDLSGSRERDGDDDEEDEDDGDDGDEDNDNGNGNGSGNGTAQPSRPPARPAPAPTPTTTTPPTTEDPDPDPDPPGNGGGPGGGGGDP